jgi:nicotinamide riboside kinase
MDSYFPLEGEITPGELPRILFNIYKKDISGLMEVNTATRIIEIEIRKKKILYVKSDRQEDNLGNYLLKNRKIDKEQYEQINNYLQKEKIKYGRALLELKIIDHEKLWEYVVNHLKQIVFSSFFEDKDHYKFHLKNDPLDENILINMDIFEFVVQGIRNQQESQSIRRFFKKIPHLYLNNTDNLSRIKLKPYEEHIFNLVKKQSALVKILELSELMEFETLKVLYLLTVFEIVSTNKSPAIKKEADNQEVSKSILI